MLQQCCWNRSNERDPIDWSRRDNTCGLLNADTKHTAEDLAQTSVRVVKPRSDTGWHRLTSVQICEKNYHKDKQGTYFVFLINYEQK